MQENPPQHRTQSIWVPAASGQLTAAGAPSQKRLESWESMGVTDVVTLQRKDEMHPLLPERCDAHGFQWHHLPLSGRRLEQETDQESLRRIPVLVSLLEQGGNVVVHCAAGMHRTGLTMYLVLRYLNHSKQVAMDLIQQARPVTAEELRKSTKKNGVLQEKAETIFQQLFASMD